MHPGHVNHFRMPTTPFESEIDMLKKLMPTSATIQNCNPEMGSVNFTSKFAKVP